ncbi:MAG: PAS domain S-box protein, partial [Sphingobacteriaceae bacterium]
MDSSNADEFYSNEQFQAFFKNSPQSLVLKADFPKFTILAVSDRYLSLTHKKRNELLGNGLFEVFPGSNADPSEGLSVSSSFNRVITSKSADELPVFKYEIFVPEVTELQTQYWSNLNEPVINGQGEVSYIINTTANITLQIINSHAQARASELEETLSREQVLNAELSTVNEELHTLNEELHRSQQELALLNFELEERVAARTKALSDSEAMMRTAITSANLGTWFINVQTREFVPSERMKVLFGFYVNEAMSIQAAMNQISETYREQVDTNFESIMNKGGTFTMEYPVIGFRDKKLRWLRSTGETYQRSVGKPAHFSGTVMDITESKLDEIRKNDFIAMVSHELKTPLTSLKAYVQMLAGKARKAEDSFTAEALDKVNLQVKKMTVMINSFL